MGRIQSDVGLITGMQITDTVDKLMKLEAKPRDLLQSQTDELTKEQTALTELMAQLFATKYISDNLGKSALFGKNSISSSNTNILSVSVTGSPALGTYQFTSLQKAQNQQFLSANFGSATSALGSGKISFRYGDNVSRSVQLSDLNGGTGFVPGKIRITDRSGAKVDVDLSAAQTLNDVVQAINSQTDINVQALVVGDRLRLIDQTNQTVSNLKVQDLGTGTTAATLGLDSIDVAAKTADGQNLLSLNGNLKLDALRDGKGIRTSKIFSDIKYTLRDGTTGTIDLSAIQSDGTTVLQESSLGEVLDKINAAAPGKLKVEIGSDGKRLVISDLTSGSGEFSFQSLYDSNAVEDLGLNQTAVNGVITGQRILGGAQSVLLSSLNGGRGMGNLGSVTLTDRTGLTATVNLSFAETLEDVVSALNSSGTALTARINDAKNGILLTDSSGATNHNLVVANADATNTAEKLQIAVDQAVNAVDSHDLHLQVVSENTLLADLNGGTGVARGRFRVTDANGAFGTINLQDKSIQTVGDLLKAIRSLPLSITAEINDTGDGIAIRSVGNGPFALQVTDLGSTAAKDLHLTGTATKVESGGSTTQLIDGAMTQTITLGTGDTLTTLRDKINQLGVGVTASIFSDGSGKPYRLSLSGNATGQVAQMVLDTSLSPIQFQETSQAHDALVRYGESGSAGSVVAKSRTNQFSQIINGATVEIQDVSSAPVTVRVTAGTTDIVANLKTLVENYNKFRTSLNKGKAYDTETNTASTLTGSVTALRLDIDMSNLLTGRFIGAGTIQSLGELGLSLKDDGSLNFDESKFNTQLQTNRTQVEQFFTTEDFGFSARFGKMIDQLAGKVDIPTDSKDYSLLGTRLNSLKTMIERNQLKMEDMQTMLDKKREQLLIKFYKMELAVSKLNSNLNALSSIDWITDTSNKDN